MAAHAKLSPSAAERWTRCPGSIALCEGIKETPSPYADEGRKAHALAETCLLKDLDAAELIDDKGTAEAVQAYVDYCRALKGEPYVEEKLDLSAWVPGCFGTADFVSLLPPTLTIVDLKFGQGVKKEAKDNEQLLIYALGALDRFELLYDFKTIKMVIVQPRLDHISEAEIPVSELLTWGEGLVDAAKAALDPEAPLIPGETQCRFCRGKALCKARAAENLKTAMEEFGPIPSAEKLSLEEIARLLPKLADIKRWAADLESYALTAAMKGERIPGHKLVRGRSMTRWTDKALELIEALPDADKLIIKKPIGITEARKVLGKGHELFKEATIKPGGKPALVKEDDKRKAITPEDLRATPEDDFNDGGALPETEN